MSLTEARFWLFYSGKTGCQYRPNHFDDLML